MAEWALTQPTLKRHVKEGFIQRDGLVLMAQDAEYFLAFLAWLTFKGQVVPESFDSEVTTKALGFEVMTSYRKALHKQFEENNLEKSDEYKTTIKTMFCGFKRNCWFIYAKRAAGQFTLRYPQL